MKGNPAIELIKAQVDSSAAHCVALQKSIDQLQQQVGKVRNELLRAQLNRDSFAHALSLLKRGAVIRKSRQAARTLRMGR